MDPKLVAAAFGKNAEGVLIYLADQVDCARVSNSGKAIVPELS